MASTSFKADGDKIAWPAPSAATLVARGSVMHWFTRYIARGNDRDDWVIFTIYVDASNYIVAKGNASANTITVRYRVGGTNYDVTFTPDAWTADAWLMFGCSWSAPAGYLRAYWAGVEVGTAIALPTAISAASATLYAGWNTHEKVLFGRRDRLEVYGKQLTATDFSLFNTMRF